MPLVVPLTCATVKIPAVLNARNPDTVVLDWNGIRYTLLPVGNVPAGSPLTVSPAVTDPDDRVNEPRIRNSLFFTRYCHTEPEYEELMFVIGSQEVSATRMSKPSRRDSIRSYIFAAFMLSPGTYGDVNSVSDPSDIGGNAEFGATGDVKDPTAREGDGTGVDAH